MLKLLIADSAESFCRVLCERLERRFKIQTCSDGNRALEILRTFRPDILVVDLSLPGLDGINLLQQARVEGMDPATLVTTLLASEYVLERLQQLEVDHVLLKPCDMASVVARVQELAQKLGDTVLVGSDRERMLSDMLLLLGLRPGLTGTTYVREAILRQCEDLNKAAAKELYPAVMRKYGAMNPEQVERCIRTAVQRAWSERNDLVWRAYFVTDAQGRVTRPSNRVFITRLAELLCLQDEQDVTQNGCAV